MVAVAPHLPKYEVRGSIPVGPNLGYCGGIFLGKSLSFLSESLRLCGLECPYFFPNLVGNVLRE